MLWPPVWKWKRPPGAIISDLDVPDAEVGHKTWSKQLLVVPRHLFSLKLLTCALWTSSVAVLFSHFSSSFEPQMLTEPYSVLGIEERESSTDTSTHVPVYSPFPTGLFFVFFYGREWNLFEETDYLIHFCIFNDYSVTA